jgi:hypothetical protein
MQGETSDSFGKQKAPSNGALPFSALFQLLPAVVSAEGDAAGIEGSTGATVSGGVAAGLADTAGVTAAEGCTDGAFEGVDTSPVTEQLQPASASSIASSGIKKNRFIMRISFRFFSVRISRRRRVIRLRRKL